MTAPTKSAVPAPTPTRGHVEVLNEIFTRAAIGDFSLDVPIPDRNDEFTDIYVGVQVMLDVIREKIREHETLNQMLQLRIKQGQETLRALASEKRKLAEAKVKDEILLDSIGEGILAMNAQGKIMMVNPAAQKMLKQPAEALIGKPIIDTVLMRDERGNILVSEDRPINQVLRSGLAISTSNYYYERSDGTVFPVITTTSPLHYHNRLAGAIVVFRDQTLEKEIDRAKSEFVSLASHQLRTPLTMINWYTQRLLSGRAGKLAPRQHHYIAEVSQGSKRMAELVQALLNVSRIELGTIIIEPEPTDLRPIIESVIGEYKPQILRKHLKISTDFLQNTPTAYIDPKLIRVAVQNIIGNAIKYTPPRGTVHIELSQSKEGKDTGPDRLLMIVKDTGYGIPGNQQDRIFNKLFRADNVQKRDTDGTGLGLYIVKSILKYSHGEVWFTSKLNKGSTFYVSLPLIKHPIDAPEKNE